MTTNHICPDTFFFIYKGYLFRSKGYQTQRINSISSYIYTQEHKYGMVI